MKEVYNFSAGPACMPKGVLAQAGEEMLDANNSGMGVMEMSHRSGDFEAILQDTKARLKRLLNVPDDYEILFLQGGASLQFSMIPMNFNRHGADLINTGQWTSKALKEARKLGEVNEIASSKDSTFSYIPKISQEDLSEESDYLYICENNTIYGTKYHKLPPHKGKRLIADLSSCIATQPIDVSQYDMIFAGAQKNLGPAGVTIVIIKKDMLEEQKDNIPSAMLDYKTYIDNDSMYNTPPTYGIYMVGLTLKWLEEVVGGLETMEVVNREKADTLYDFLDSSKLFSSPVAKEDRSFVNIPFVTGNPELDKKFIREAEAAGFVNLKGHRSVGGMRASIYNAMPYSAVVKLVDFMRDFEKRNLHAND